MNNEEIRPQARLTNDQITRERLIIEFDPTLTEDERNRRTRLLNAGLLHTDVSPPTRPERAIDPAEARRIVEIALGLEPGELPPPPISRAFLTELQLMVLRELRKKP